ncbi:MAG TPA: CHASE3 domain-containing protein, partial [Longimicrobiales bacterium]|nr:CHASE3 domain-containing protein [Longimicrobiales bacterium]
MSEPRPVAPRFRTDWLALAFVGLALVLLLVAPLVTSVRTAELRERDETVVEPVRDATTGVQFELARQMSNLRGFLLTGDTLFIVRYGRLRAEQDSTLDEIARLAADLGPEATGAAAALRERVHRWHERVDPGNPGLVQGIPAGSIPPDQRLYEEAVASAVDLDQLVSAMGRDMRERIRRAELTGFVLTLTLVAIALIATAVLVWFGRRLQRLADEARRQRHEAELALASTREAAQARDRLIRGVTHDVKNPLGAADGYAELLELGLRGALS